MSGNERIEIRRFLEARLGELTHTAQSRGTGLEVCADLNEFASRLTDQQITLALQEREVRMLSEVEEALYRLEYQDYGICEECGEDIGLARIKAKPTARLCVHCQEQEERGLLN